MRETSIEVERVNRWAGLSDLSVAPSSSRDPQMHQTLKMAIDERPTLSAIDVR